MNDGRCRVLLVEDTQIDQMAFKRMVSTQNLPYDYKIAGSVREARDLLASEKFDAIILDFHLGDGTAFDVLGSVGQTPTIFATGGGDEELAVKAMKSGASDYLIKDQDRNYLKVLPEVVKNAIHHKKAELELEKYHNNLEALVKERAEQLATEKELLSVTLASMGDGLIAVDADKHITLFNTVAENILRCRFDDVHGLSVDDVFKIVEEQTRAPAESPVDKVFDSEKIETQTSHCELVAKDGSSCPVSATAAPIRSKDGAMIGVVMVFRDVSREREIERLKADFISSMSHELRTPLTSIKAYTETILSTPDMPAETRGEFLGIIDEESDRLASLIESLLEISKLESGAVELHRELFDIAAVIKHVKSTLQPLADKKNIKLTLRVNDGLPPYDGDKGKMESVITNLANNAIKFTPEGGGVEVTAEGNAGELKVSVRDTGMGIPKESLTKIFGRFYRVYRPGTHIQGTGLGLAIVKEIVMMHGGRIEVESEVDKGTTFTVFLPLETAVRQMARAELSGIASRKS
jgi:PAS domain S-box-containing protein